jgi:hypothetical protein
MAKTLNECQNLGRKSQGKTPPLLGVRGNNVLKCDIEYELVDWIVLATDRVFFLMSCDEISRSVTLLNVLMF